MSRLIDSIRRSISRRLSSQSSQWALVVRRNTRPEDQKRYQKGGYHPIRVGELYQGRYQVIEQLGWGRYSTVWLVQDTQTERNAALKVLVGDLSTDRAGPWDEREMLRIVRDTDPQAPGYQHICHLLDEFTHTGPNGDHICLVFEPMGLNVSELTKDTLMPMFLLKRMTKHMLLALRYLHDCGIVHTDLKGDNILMTGAPVGMTQTEVGLSTNDLLTARFKLTDLGAAIPLSRRNMDMAVQPGALRAPEVIIRAEWDTKIDIWNLGCLIFEFGWGQPLFIPHHDVGKSGLSITQTHLTQMVTLLGQFPRTLLDRGKRSDLFFDSQGRLLKGTGKYPPNSIARMLSSAAGVHDQADFPALADFLAHALTVDPEERWSAAQLLEHPWLQDVIEY